MVSSTFAETMQRRSEVLLERVALSFHQDAWSESKGSDFGHRLGQ
jgi:hypothetical protein